MKKIIFRALVLAGTLFALYYLFFLGPSLRYSKELAALESALAAENFNLVQNRLALINLARIEPESPGAYEQVMSNFENLKSTRQIGIANTAKPSPADQRGGREIAEIAGKIPELSGRAGAVYERQDQLIAGISDWLNLEEKRFSVLKQIIGSDENLANLTAQTNLIREYDYWLKKIDELQRN